MRAELLLHGSFADTGRGHGTDRALIAGLLGMEPDDSRIPDSFDHAAEHGLKFEFGTCTLREAHPNSVLLRVTGGSGRHVDLRTGEKARKTAGGGSFSFGSCPSRERAHRPRRRNRGSGGSGASPPSSRR